MASITKEIQLDASAEAVWDAVRDIGALHTRLVPGFVLATRMEPGARIVTFFNGLTVREEIISLDEATRRLVWSAKGAPLTHHNGSAQVVKRDEATFVIWTADFLPNEAAASIDALMEAGAQAMRQAFTQANEIEA